MREANHVGPLKAKLVDWLAGGGSITRFAAANPQRSERQYRRYAGQPAVRAAVRDRVAELNRDTARRYGIITAASTEALRRLVTHEDPAISLAAIREARRGLVDLGKFADLEGRVIELERRTDGRRP